MSVAPYPEYKDSGVEWVGTIPSHWQVAPLITVATEVEERNFDLKNKNLLSLSYGRIIIKDIDSNDGLLPESFESYQVLKPNDIVLRLTDLQNDKRSLRTALCRHSGIITSAYLGLRPVPGFSLYLSQLLHSYDITKVFYSLGGGLRQTIKFDDVRRLPILIPPSHEQATIAAFLDQEAGKIDALVAEQERLIALLKEKRQAVISQAVTKGLNPNAPMKDSGIEWLGQVPAHWETRKVSHLFRAGKGKNGQMLTKEFGAVNEGPYPVYSGQTEDEGVMGTWYEFEFDFGEIGVLFCTTVGARAMHLKQLYGRFSLSQNCMIVWPTDSRCITRFFFYHFQPLFQWERSLIPDHMQPSFRMEDLYSFSIGVPPITEQKEIVEFLDSETQKIDTLITEATQAITLLRERRAALISAAVTGKIDVRSLTPTKQEAA